MLRITSREKLGNQGGYSTGDYHGNDYIPRQGFNLVGFPLHTVNTLTHTFRKSPDIRPELCNVPTAFHWRPITAVTFLIGVQRKTFLRKLRTFALYYSFIFLMASDPKPYKMTFIFKRKRPVTATDSDGPEVCHFLEMKGGMSRVTLQQSEILKGQVLCLFGKPRH